MTKCRFGDSACPCQDGDPCHYEGANPMCPPGYVLDQCMHCSTQFWSLPEDKGSNICADCFEAGF